MSEHIPHPHQPGNVNALHEERLSLDSRLARWVSQRVGTMKFCYGLALLMLLWGGFNIILGRNSPDPYPFSFLFFCLGGIMQSLLMPLIMVAQNLNTRHQELQSEEIYHMAQKTCSDNKTLIEQNNQILALLETKPRRQVRREKPLVSIPEIQILRE